ncbi:MAG: hypothetical protein ACK55P_07385, partial [Planctomyces sp.]
GFVKVIEDAAYREQLIAQGRVNRTRFELSTIAEQFLEVYRLVAAEATDEHGLPRIIAEGSFAPRMDTNGHESM